MKIIHIANSDVNGGAAIAADRICSAQQNISGIESKLLVQSKKSSKKYVYSTQSNLIYKLFHFYRTSLDLISIKTLTQQSRGRYSLPFWGEDISKIDLVIDSDIINLHWINGGFLSLKSLNSLSKLKKPIVWTLHDMWPFTGGCHYSSGCDKYVSKCFCCPSLLFKSQKDLSSKIFNRKKEIYKNLNLTIIACSKWLANEASRSQLFGEKKVYPIPNAIDTDTFKPIDKCLARLKLKLPQNKKLILVGAMNLNDERKGLQYLIKSLDFLKKIKSQFIQDYELLVFGKLNQDAINKIPVKVNQLGKLTNLQEIVYAYNSSNIFVAPSLEDNLPNTIMEAMACGIPTIAFNVGGIPDMIDDGQNGILVESKSTEDLANGIQKLLDDEELQKKYGLVAKEKVRICFNQKMIAEKYLEIYKNLKLHI